MVSAPTEVSGSFSESKILCSGECVCVGVVGGEGGKGGNDAERRSGHSPKIF